MVHAGEDVGLGHLTRSLVAARSLMSRLDVRIDFVAVGQKIDDALASDFEVSFSVMHGAIDAVIDQLTENKQYAAICLDLFNSFLVKGLGLILENLRKTGCQIVAIDSLMGFERLIDLLYVPSFLQPSYLATDEFQGQLAYGWNAYLLNVEAKSESSNQSDSILVLTGGGDVTKLGQDWPTILNRCLPPNTVVHWVTGPFSESPAFPDSSNIEFIEHIAPTGLSDLMHEASVAITVFGVSFFELIALGVPTVVFSPYGDKDSIELQEITEQRIALVAKDAIDAGELAAMLMKDSQLRSELSRNAIPKMKNFDGEYFAEEIRLLLTA